MQLVWVPAHGSVHMTKCCLPRRREEGDLGPVYGFQWRHFGAQYKDMHTDYTGVRMVRSDRRAYEQML